MTRKSTVQPIGNNTSASAQALVTTVPRTVGPAPRGRHTDDPTTITAPGPAPDADPAHRDAERAAEAAREAAPYPWDRNRDGWLDDPGRFLEHAEQRRAALADDERAAALAQLRATRATDVTTTVGAAAASTRPDATGRAHLAVALANATAVASRASYPADLPPSRRAADRSRDVAAVGAVAASSGPDVRRHYRPTHVVPAVASRYL
jgi:hypothetical protein